MTTPLDERKPNARILFVAGLLVLCFVALGVRLADLTILQNSELAARAQRQQSKTLRMAASRGSILDSHRRTLAHTIWVPSVYASPRYHQVSGELVPQLAMALGMSEAALERRIQRDKGFVWLRRNVTTEQARAVERLRVPGVGRIMEPRRRYPRGELAAHVLGTAAGSELRGRYGVELRYDRWMRGEDTVIHLERDGRGQTMLTRAIDQARRHDSDDAPAPGATLELTIDARLQALVERELAKGVESARAESGTVVVMDPHSGAVLALANYPTYDPNAPGSVEPGHRRNRSVTDPVEPGSTFKAFTLAAALDAGAVGVEDVVDCENGAFRVGRRTIHDDHAYDLLSVPEVLQYSSNIGTTKIARSLGADRFFSYLKEFGFGRVTAVDLPGESAGILRGYERWAEIDFANISFGQGVAVTPIQLTSAFGAIANGGVLYQPYVVARATDDDGRVLFDWDDEKRQAASRRVVRSETAAAVVDMLQRVVSDGTGKKAGIAGVGVAGKTGTAQKVDPETRTYGRERLASFIGFAPAENPDLVTLVMIDNPKGITYGGLVAAPVFREITSQALDHLGRRPRLEVSPPPVLPAAGVGTAAVHFEGDAAEMVPSFLGLSLKRALARARRDGLEVEVRGHGFVRHQDPAPGTSRQSVSKLRLLLEPSV